MEVLGFQRLLHSTRLANFLFKISSTQLLSVSVIESWLEGKLSAWLTVSQLCYKHEIHACYLSSSVG